MLIYPNSRKCDSCTLCCTVTAVPELKKPQNITCGNCDNGCKIYDSRPHSCRNFSCGWLRGDLPEEMRPNKIGFLVEIISEKTVLVLVDPNIKNWRTAEVESELRKEYVSKGISVVASDGLALIPVGVTPKEVMEDILASARRMGVI